MPTNPACYSGCCQNTQRWPEDPSAPKGETVALKKLYLRTLAHLDHFLLHYVTTGNGEVMAPDGTLYKCRKQAADPRVVATFEMVLRSDIDFMGSGRVELEMRRDSEHCMFVVRPRDVLRTGRTPDEALLEVLTDGARSVLTKMLYQLPRAAIDHLWRGRRR